MSKRKGTWTTVWAICGAFCFVFGIVYALASHTNQSDGTSIPSLHSANNGTIGPQGPPSVQSASGMMELPAPALSSGTGWIGPPDIYRHSVLKKARASKLHSRDNASNNGTPTATATAAF